MSWARRRQADMKADANARGTMTLGDWLAAAATFVALALIGYGTVRRDWPTVRRAVADSMRRMGYRTVTSRMITDGDVYRTETVVTPVSRKCHQVKRGLGYNDGTGHEAWGLFEECD